MIALCSKGAIFRRSYVQRVLCSENICSEGPMFKRSHIQKILCSESPMFRNICSEGPILRRSYMFRRSYIQKYLFGRFYIQKFLCLEGLIFRRSFVQKVLCWDTFPSFSFRYKNISRFFFISFITYSLLLGIHASEFQRYDVPKSPKFPELGNPEPKFRSSVVMRGVLRCVFFVID